MANPTVFNAVATNPGGTGSTITVTLSTHAAGDLLIIYVGNTGNVLWTGNPTGWNRIDQRTVGTSSNGLVGTWLWKKATSSSETNPVCTLGATVTRLATCRTIRGADTESPFVTPNYGSRGFGVGTANPVRPPTIVTPAPETLTLICYAQRTATNAPDPSGYTADTEAIVSGTLVVNAASQAIADQNTTLANQDASPTSGARWVAGIICIPSDDYAYYRAGSQATTASGTSVTPTKPTGTTNSDTRGNKDVMLATVEGSGSTTLSAQDTGLWTEIGGAWSGTTSGGGSSVKKFWCYATATPNMQFNRTGTGEISACITTYYNCNQTNPIGVFDADARASSTTSTWDAITRNSTKSVVIATCVADGTPTFTAPSGWTERMDGLGISCADQTYNATGSSASASFTLSAGSPTLVGLLEVIGVASVTLITVTPANASLALSSFAPKLTNTTTPSKATVTLAAFAPSVLISGALIDDFNDNSRDTSKWSLGSIAFQNAAVGVAETNQRVEITPLANEPSAAIYGYKSAGTYDFTGRQARVRIAAGIGADTEAWLVVALDTANYVRTWVAGGTLQTRSRENNTNSNQSHGSFDFATQSHWRIRHDNATNEIVWEVGTSGNWTELRRLTTPFSITAITVYMSGGTGGSVASPALVTFDDFALNVLTQVIPTNSSLALTGFAPRLITAVVPASAARVLSAFAPTVSVSGGETVLTPATSSLATTRFTPKLVVTITPANASLTASRFAPSLHTAITPSSPGVTLTTFAPSVTTRVTVPVATLSLTGFAPSLRVTVTPSSPSLSATMFAPSLVAKVTIPAGSVSLTGLAPSLRLTTTPTSQSLVLTTQPPTIGVSVTPAAISLTLATFAPSVVSHTILTPATSVVTATGNAPQLREITTVPATSLTLSALAPEVVAGANVSVTPATATLALAGNTPTLQETVTPVTNLLSLSTFAPTVETTADIAVVPTVSVLTISGFTPLLIERVTPSATALSMTTFAPSLTISADIVASPSVTTLTLTSFAPALHEVLTPNVSALTLTAFTPTVTTSADIVVEPAAQTLTISSFVSSLQVSLTPGAGLLSLTTLVPSVRSGTELIPATQTFIISTFTPRLELRVLPPVRSLILTGFAPDIEGSETVFYPRNIFTASRESRILSISRERRVN